MMSENLSFANYKNEFLDFFIIKINLKKKFQIFLAENNLQKWLLLERQIGDDFSSVARIRFTRSTSQASGFLLPGTSSQPLHSNTDYSTASISLAPTAIFILKINIFYPVFLPWFCCIFLSCHVIVRSVIKSTTPIKPMKTKLLISHDVLVLFLPRKFRKWRKSIQK